MQEAADKRKQLEAEYQEALRSLQAKQEDVRQLKQAQEVAKKTQRQAVEQLETKVQELERKCREQTESFNQLSQELSSLRREANKRAGSPKVEIAIQTSPESLSDEGFGENGHITPKNKETVAKKQSGIVSASLAAEGVLDDQSQGGEFNDGSWVEDVSLKKERRKQMEAAKSIDTGFVEGEEEPLGFANDEWERRRLLEEAGVVGLDDDLSYSADIRRLTTSDTEDDTFPMSKGDAPSTKSDRSAKGDRSRSRSRSSKDVLENGKVDSGSEAEDLMDEISDKIDMNILRHTAAPKRDKLAVFIARYSYDPMQYSPNESPESELALNAGEYIYVYGNMDEDGFYEGELMDGRRGLVPSNFIERVADEDDVNTEDEDMPEFLQEPADTGEDNTQIQPSHDTVKTVKKRSTLPPLPLPSQPPPVTAASPVQPVASSPTPVAAPDPTSTVTIETEKTKEEVVQSSEEAMIEELAAEIESTFSKDLNSDPDPSKDPSSKQGEHLNDLEFDSSDEDNAGLKNKLTYPNDLAALRRGDHQVSDLEDIPEVEEENVQVATIHKLASNEDSLTSISEIDDLSLGVACPKKLELEKQMPNSIILQWVAPDTIAPPDIKEYRVYVDGRLKASVKGDAKTRALIEKVNASQSHRISVRTVTNAGMSEDAACTITIGKEATAAPSELKAVNVLPTAADIIWLPGNSNLAHAISVNNVEVKIVKPSTYRYTLTGLSPMTVYRVNVRAKARRTSWDDNRNKRGMSAEIEFKTPPGGLPDPPLDMQVEEGPYEGSLLVTWLPVTITTSGTSNGAVVTGYAVCVDEKEIAVVDSPTADRAVVNVNKVKSSTYRYLTVRTLSTNGASADSRGLRITMDLLRDKKSDSDKDAKHHKHRDHHRFKHRHRVGGGMYDNITDDTTSAATSTHTDETVEIFRKETVSPISNPAIDDKLDQVPKDEIASAKKPEIRPSFREELHSDESSDRSELSDIAEEAEEELSEFGDDEVEKPDNANNSQLPPPKKDVKSNHELEFDTDPEIEQFSKQEQTVPIPVIRQQRDYERETEQSPDHHVQEPVPVKAQPMSVPHIGQYQTKENDSQITKDSNSEGLGTGSSISEQYGSDGEYDPGRHQRYVPSQMRDKKPYYPNQYGDNYNRYEERKDTYGGSDDQHRRKYDYRNSLSPNHSRGLSDDDLVDEESMESEAPEELYDDSTIRYFVAMFTYDPVTMSPNPDAYDEELPFREGQMIKVYGDKDADGFYRERPMK
ncbi:RIMS-binding protein 2-like isoform X2 [Ptychodera flava]|uniref:RIMS-binding protein 2-like isoform X2 n=1 Tax=Ptychodera flava TaxID=63121 RepID=UPI003969DCA1